MSHKFSKIKAVSGMVGKIPSITETSSYNKLDVQIESWLIGFASCNEPGRARDVSGDGIQRGIQREMGVRRHPEMGMREGVLQGKGTEK